MLFGVFYKISGTRCGTDEPENRENLFLKSPDRNAQWAQRA